MKLVSADEADVKSTPTKVKSEESQTHVQEEWRYTLQCHSSPVADVVLKIKEPLSVNQGSSATKNKFHRSISVSRTNEI